MEEHIRRWRIVNPEDIDRSPMENPDHIHEWRIVNREDLHRIMEEHIRRCPRAHVVHMGRPMTTVDIDYPIRNTGNVQYMDELNWGNIPAIVLEKIFKKRKGGDLITTHFVCQRWNEVTEYMWKKVCEEGIDLREFELLLQCHQDFLIENYYHSPNIFKLYHEQPEPQMSFTYDAYLIRHFSPIFSQITELLLPGIIVNATFIRTLCSREFRQLEKLFIHVNEFVLCLHINQLFTRHVRLDEVTLWGHKCIYDDLFMAIMFKHFPWKCTQLTLISVQHKSERPLRPFSITFKNEHPIRRIARYCMNLQILALDSCIDLAPDFCLIVLQYLKNLQIFRFNNNDSSPPTDTTFYPYYEHSKLEEIFLLNNASVNYSMIELINRACINLKCFGFGFMPFSHKEFLQLRPEISQNLLQNEEIINITYAKSLTALQLFNINSNPFQEYFVNFENLTHLTVISTTFNFGDVANNVLIRSKQLEVVVLFGRKFLENDLKNVCSGLNLKEELLDIQYMKNLKLILDGADLTDEDRQLYDTYERNQKWLSIQVKSLHKLYEHYEECFKDNFLPDFN